jgi:phage tail-like protein
MALVPRNDPYGGYNFEVTVTGISPDGKAVTGSFMEVSGLEAEVAAIDYRNGSEDIRVRKLPGLKKFKEVVLKRGIIADLAFWNWILAAMKGDVQRQEAAIKLLNEQRQEVMRWTLTRAWPGKWSGPGLNAKNSEIAIETIEIHHEGLAIDGQT